MEGLTLTNQELGYGGDDRCTVEATREARSNPDVRTQVQPDGVIEERPKAARRFGLADREPRLARQVVITADGQAITRAPGAKVDGNTLSGAKLTGLGEHRLIGMVGIASAQKVEGARKVHPAGETRLVDQLLDLGGERQTPASGEIV